MIQRRDGGYSRSLDEPAIARVPVVVGPTGIGKSALALDLARELDGEIVVADSRQVYERLDIATNKPSPEDRVRARYHMIDFVDPKATFNAAEYVVGARAAIDDILGRGRLPIVEGGTMLYVDALCDGFTLTGVPPDPDLRAQLDQVGVGELRARLLELDPDPGVDLQNPVRMIRAIEVLSVAGPPLKRLRKRTAPGWTPVRIGLTADLDEVDQRLAARSRRQVERGLIAETQAALDSGVLASAPVLSGIGYAEALAHIKGELTLEQLPLAMAQSNRRYARRQLRWWRRDPRVRWFEIEPLRGPRELTARRYAGPLSSGGLDPLPAILNYVKEAQ